jgi:dihydrofolate synthase/folylpolyglutamate synthase
MNSLLPHLKRIKPTFFETMTALALYYFTQEKVDYAIMEVGLGGRLDATNIINPLVSIITRIDFDHTDKLGNTLTKIAREKAGIIKPNTPVLTIKQQPEVMRVIRAYARKLKAPLYQIPKSKYLMSNFKCGVVGQHQKENFALALAAYEYLRPASGDLRRGSKTHDSQRITQDALRRVVLPARIEVVSRNPLTIIDTAHNPVSMKALVDTIKTEFRYKQLVLVIGLARDKEVDKILRIILPLADIIIFTKSDNPRLLEPMDFVDYIKDYDLAVPIFLEPNYRQALRTAQSVAGRKDLILITGSFYLAGSLYPLVKRP